jgi:hypothetical protein
LGHKKRSKFKGKTVVQEIFAKQVFEISQLKSGSFHHHPARNTQRAGDLNLSVFSRGKCQRFLFRLGQFLSLRSGKMLCVADQCE